MHDRGAFARLVVALAGLSACATGKNNFYGDAYNEAGPIVAVTADAAGDALGDAASDPMDTSAPDTTLVSDAADDDADPDDGSAGESGSDDSSTSADGSNDDGGPGVCGFTNDPNAKLCAGCCSGSTCMPGTSDTQCGVGGHACGDCTPAGDKCMAGVCSTSTPADAGSGGTSDAGSGRGGRGGGGPSIVCLLTCYLGCCRGDMCLDGVSDSACGGPFGAACVDCTASAQTCQAGVCRTPRNPPPADAGRD